VIATEAYKAVVAFLGACKDSGLAADDVRSAFCEIFKITDLPLISEIEELRAHAEALANSLSDLRGLPSIPLKDFEESGRVLFAYRDRTNGGL